MKCLWCSNNIIYDDNVIGVLHIRDFDRSDLSFIMVDKTYGTIVRRTGNIHFSFPYVVERYVYCFRCARLKIGPYNGLIGYKTNGILHINDSLLVYEDYNTDSDDSGMDDSSIV